MTFVVKLHVQWHFDGWTERKEEEICPAKEWSSSIQRMPVNWHNPKVFLDWSTGGFQCWASRVLLVFCSTSYLKIFLVIMKTSRARTRIGNHCCKHFLVLPKFSSWFPMTPLLQLKLCFLFVVFVEDQWPWPLKPVSITIELVFEHLTWLKWMFPNIQTTWGVIDWQSLVKILLKRNKTWPILSRMNSCLSNW